MLEGDLYQNHQIAEKALAVRSLAHEMNKLLDLTKASDEVDEPANQGTATSFKSRTRTERSSRIRRANDEDWNTSWA
ncbi:MAG: hypothetical protein Q9180_001385 [Flavoplaca navasiana]